ncbi:hypothetical protein [Streptomyces sp. NPDC096012]|uniref:hypothetical protein n=1 Tax=Streptomyces sp. NPDC096012 TaxID=3155684 RepID=UPI00336AD09D
MILVPWWLWARGPVVRALGAGLAAGVFFGAFVLVESGSWAGALVVLVVLGLFYGVRVARRMAGLWPAARHMNSADRAAVVRATRRGEAVGDPRLAPSVAQYADALRRGAEEDLARRWIVVLVSVFAVVLAVYDTLMGTRGEMIASWLVVVLFLADLLWWPRRRDRLLARSGRAAAASARRPPAAGSAPQDS